MKLPPMKKPAALAAAALLLAAGAAATLLVHAASDKTPTAAAAPARAALTVTVTAPVRATVATGVAANGNVAAWQEAIVGAEAQGMRLLDVRVNVGDVVRKGQVLCIIEAMKLMNEIDSEYDGEITSVYVENGQAVQYGERLFAIRPTT